MPKAVNLARNPSTVVCGFRTEGVAPRNTHTHNPMKPNEPFINAAHAEGDFSDIRDEQAYRVFVMQSLTALRVRVKSVEEKVDGIACAMDSLKPKVTALETEMRALVGNGRVGRLDKLEGRMAWLIAVVVTFAFGLAIALIRGA